MANFNNKLGILAFILILFTLPLISAAEPADFVATQLQPYRLIALCTDSGLVCSVGNTQCNISLRDSENSHAKYIIFQNNMSIAENGDASYLFNSSSMGLIGRYPGFVSCSNGVYNKTEPFVLLVTASGENSNNLTYLALFLSVGSFILLAFSIQQGNAVLGFLTGICFLLTGLLIFTTGLFNYQSLYTQGIASIHIVFFAWCGLSSGLTWMEEMKIRYS